MRIEAIDLFYVSMPVVTDAPDGSQDALLVRMRGGGHTAWGECEASPLTSIASMVCPMSHGACRSVGDVLRGETLNDPADIARISGRVKFECMDLLQAAHTFSGIEAAMWDLLGRAKGEPAWRLLGYDKAYAKTPYASQLFGETPDETLAKGRAAVQQGFRAVKFGWGPFGHGDLKSDQDQLIAAREGIGSDAILLVDAGQVFGEDVERAAARLPTLEAVRATWLEEPFYGSSLGSPSALAARSPLVGIAGGEASHNALMAKNLIDFGGIKFVQIDCGRIGGLGPAHEVACHAAARGVTYVNHTYTSHLALSASLQPYAGLAEHRLCEYPVAPQPLAHELTRSHIRPDGNGEIRLPDGPGLAIEISADALRRYLVDTEIKVNGRVLYRTPTID